MGLTKLQQDLTGLKHWSFFLLFPVLLISPNVILQTSTCPAVRIIQSEHHYGMVQRPTPPWQLPGIWPTSRSFLCIYCLSRKGAGWPMGPFPHVSLCVGSHVKAAVCTGVLQIDVPNRTLVHYWVAQRQTCLNNRKYSGITKEASIWLHYNILYV